MYSLDMSPLSGGWFAFFLSLCELLIYSPNCIFDGRIFFHFDEIFKIMFFFCGQSSLCPA